MAAYWSSFASGVVTQAADFAADMLPIIVVLAGIALAERVIWFVRSVANG